MMIIFKKAGQLQAYLDTKRRQGRAIGFVPTMGALHAGHLSLIARSGASGHVTVCSIFVNPTQFNDPNDFARYPITIEADIALLQDSGCEVLFLPEVSEVYPEGTAAAEAYDFAALETVLEGSQRPGHFRGVGQVMGRLLHIVGADTLYMGQKDYQQCLVIRSLLRQMHDAGHLRALPELEICAIVREADGLAMSSRNRLLTEGQRIVAGAIYQCLVSVQSKKTANSFSIVQKECMDLLQARGLQPEYVALADAESLSVLDDYTADAHTIALIAARAGNVRLIDNMMIG